MGKNLLTTFSLMMLFIFASCLPQEKTTQCGSGESYNSTQRRCIASLANSTDSISISGVTPSNSYAVSDSDSSKTHAVTISDPFNIGYSIRWYVTAPTGSQSLVATGTTYTFVHTSYTSGSYILEVQVLTSTGSSVLDSRSWTVNVIDEVTPSLSSSTPTPFSTTTTNGTTTINATASNPDTIPNVDWQWYVNGNPISIAGTDSGSFNTTTQALSFDFDPSSSSTYFTGSGVYTVQVQLTEDGTGVLYDSYTWTITNNLPGFASASLGTAVSGTASGNATPNTAAIMTVLDETDIFAGGFKNDIDGDGDLDDIDFCVQINNNNAASDETAGVDGNNVYVDFLENGVAIPNATSVQITAELTSFCLGDIVNAAGSSYDMDIPDNLTVESRTITAVVYDGYSGASSNSSYNGGTELTRYTWTNRVRQLNTPPVVTINSGADSTITSCTYSTTSATNCAITQDATVQLAITVSDDDYEPDTDSAQFSVYYYLDGQLLDTSHSLSGSDCELDSGAAPTGTDANTYICSLTINSYDSDGPIDNVASESYSLSAVVYDTGSPYNLVDPKQSNTVTWQIPAGNLTAADTASTLTPFTIAAGAADPDTETFLQRQDAMGTALNLNGNSNLAAPQVTEGENIVFNLVVQDSERDSFYVRILRCDDGAACGSTTAVATKTVNSTNDDEFKDTQVTINISEDAVIDDNIADVYYRVIIRENSTATADLSQEIIYLAVRNNNPDPSFNTANFSPALNTIGTEYVVYSGFPITLDPGTITDASLSDGVTVTYQWMVSVDGDSDNLVGDGDADDDYVPIDGATSRVLVWSPGSELDYALQSGKLISIKLCIGDNGWDTTNDVEKTPMNEPTNDDCLNATLDSGEWYFTGISNMYAGRSYDDDTTNNPSQGLADVWIDQEQFAATGDLVKYMAYVNLDNEIVVEKIVTFADSSKGGSAETIEEIESIIFASTSDGTYATNPVTYLSMTGDSTNKALYIAYMAEVNGNDLVHIRRIDISGGKTAFSHDGKFGYDPDNATTDDILNNITLGANLSSVFDATTGSLLITVGAPLDATATTIQFDNLNEGSGSVTLTEDIEFCLLSTCSTIALSAQSIADAINASAELELQGLTATSDGVDTVTVEGIYQTDFLELDIRAGALGDIMINKTSDRWEIPYIDADKAAGDKFKISIYSGDLGIRLSNCNDTSVLLAGTVPAQELANDILESDKDADAADDQGLAIGDTDKVLIAVKALSSGEIQLYEYDNGYALLETNADLFSDDDVTDIKLNISQNSSNTNAFLVGRNSSSAIAFARISHTAGDFDVAGAETILDLDNDFELIENDNASEYDIAAGTTSNQALFLSVDTANSVAYLSTIQSNGLGSATIDCSYDSDQDLTKCMKIQTVTGDSVFDLGVTLGDAVEGVTLGVDGDTAGESTNDIIPLVYHINDGGGNPAADAIPVLGIININGVNFSNDNTAFGANYIIPYVND